MLSWLKKPRYLFLFGLFALTSWFHFFYTTPPTSTTQTQLEQGDWFVYQMQSWQIDRKDPMTFQYTQADQMQQSDDQIKITRPKIYISTQAYQVELTANLAIIDGQDDYSFQGNVQLHHTQNTQTTQLTTNYLLYNRDSEILSSPDSVELNSDNYFARGKGMQINLKEQTTEIQSEVMTRYDNK